MTTENSDPLISVIVATYQGDALAHLTEAIDSVLGQSHRNLELIVIADGPLSAESDTYLRACAERDHRIVRLALDRNSGPGAARNRGIAHARGEYIAILDADDKAAPERLQTQLAFLRASGADLVGSAYRTIDAAGAVTGAKRFPLHPEVIRRAMVFYNPIANSTVFARAEVLKRHPYPESIRYGEDYALWITLARAGHTLRNQPEPLVDFRANDAFMQRRRGLHHASTELRNKLRTVPLYPVYLWPGALGIALMLGLARLLPAPLLRWFYGIRAGLN